MWTGLPAGHGGKGKRMKLQKIGEKLPGKYALYYLCFLALNYIEYLCANKAGNVWKTAANCTGLVIMVIVFSQLPIRQFLKPVYYGYTVLCMAAIGLIYLHWRQHIGEYCFGQMATAVMNVWWLGMAVPWFFRKVIEEKTLKLRIGALGWTWILFAVWSVISVAGRWWPVWYLLMFGTFYLTRFSREDKEALTRAMVDGTIASFFILQTFAYLFRPYDRTRYHGAFVNSNMMALYYLIIYCMVLVKLHLLHAKGAKWGWKLFYGVGAAGLLGFQFLTICRTSWVCSIVITLYYGWTVLHRTWGEKIRKVVLRGCALGLSAVVLFPVVFWTVRWLPTIHPHPIWHPGEWQTDSVFSWDPPDSEKYVEMDEFLEDALGRIVNVLKLLQSRNPFVLHAYARAEDVIPEPDYDWQRSSLTVRKVFFQTYWEHATWLGHPEEDGHYVFGESGVYMWHSQNLWIQMVYYFGYPAGILVFLMLALSLWKALKKAGTLREDSYAILPIIIWLVYFMFGLVEVVWNPGQLIFTYVFLVMHPQLAGEIQGGAEALPERAGTEARERE